MTTFTSLFLNLLFFILCYIFYILSLFLDHLKSFFFILDFFFFVFLINIKNMGTYDPDFSKHDPG